ncbi:class I SAM-dependent methyltransferase [Marivivens aquimaris]|uniref:class I SAM-dependent methyltransferase n=1 Tax=Marivivens aquimaris TaxID=2774876 RepID=UPI001D15EDFE|nr:class I SAM-dependent methyltransferase [Marivivens aquimaris]
MTTEDPKAYWEEFYQTKRTTSSGTPSGILVRVTTDMAPGRALDLGSSNGDDVIWLAEQGWDAVGVDISETACERARGRAETLELKGTATFEAMDLTERQPEGPFDLVTALFFQSSFDFPRGEILNKVSKLVAKGGTLLIVAHASAPPWASEEMKERAKSFPTIESELTDLQATEDDWEFVQVGIATRPAKSPEGEHAQLEDTVIHLRRK